MLTGKSKAKMYCAYLMISNCRKSKEYRITSKMYEKCRRELGIYSAEHNRGRKISEETRLKMSKAHLGIKQSEETRRRISKANKGRKKTPEHVNKINRNPEKIRKTAEKHRGMKRTPEARAKMRAAKVGWIPWNKGVKGVSLGKNCYYDPVTLETHKYLDGTQPEGWLRGRPNSRKKPKEDQDQNPGGIQ
jgi:hypothetical protein